jgi:hypothetical protein
MGAAEPEEVTGLLRAWSGGDEAAMDRLAAVFTTNCAGSRGATCATSSPAARCRQPPW